MSESFVDAKGRKITLRKLTVLDQVRLLRAIGSEQSRNQPYVEIVTMAASVSDIDGTPFVMPFNERQIDAAIDRIGDDGFGALMVHMRSEIKAIEDAAEAAASSPLAPSA